MISIIIPLYQEEKSIGILLDQIPSVLEGRKLDYEVICINDGGGDEIEHLLANEIKSRKDVTLVNFSRNYGQSAAIEAGLAHSNGDIIITMDGDLQNDPRDIPKLLAKLEEGYDVVVGWRRNRKDAFLTRKIPSYLGNKLIAKIIGLSIHDYGCGLKVFRKKVLGNIQFWGEVHRLLPVYMALNGAKITEVEITHYPRKYGRSKYSLLRGFKLIVDLFVAKFMSHFATRSNYLFGITGVFSFFSSIAMTIGTIIFSIEKGLLMAMLLAILGFQLLLVGLFSEILMRIYYLIQRRPTYVIREIVRSSDIEKRNA